MIAKHRISLYINGNLCDLSESETIRLNDVLFEPTKLTATTSTYSYSFKIPNTSNNNRIFGDINVLARKGKFNQRFNTILYSDEILLFEGELLISEIKSDGYSVNLYIPRNYSISELFGDTTMNCIDWKVPFTGIPTINSVNADETKKYFFPYVAYSLPIKKPYEVSNSGYRHYTDKKTIDEYTYFYFNSFVPSLNMSELARRCFEYKGITLEGDILTDPILNSIYLSNYISDEQDPLYNYGENELGDVKLNIKFGNSYIENGKLNVIYDNATIYDIDGDKKPKIKNGDPWDFRLNWDYLYAYNLLSLNDSEYHNYRLKDGHTQNQSLYLSYNSNAAKILCDGGFQIPCTGYYEITLEGSVGVDPIEGGTEYNSFEDISYDYWVVNPPNKSVDQKKATLTYNTNDFPIEFQLLAYNAEESQDTLNHNPIWAGVYPNENKGLSKNGVFINSYDMVSSKLSNDRPKTALMDVYNNPNYICGLSLNYFGHTIGYIKNGSSWNDTEIETNDCLYNCNGYYELTKIDKNTYKTTETSVNENSLSGYTKFNEVSRNGRNIEGTTKMIIKLEKNTVIVPFLQTRGLPLYDDNTNIVTYGVNCDMNIRIRAVGLENDKKSSLSYGMDSNFDEYLNLGNFCNDNEKMSDFISNIQKTFNLSYEKNGDIVKMNMNNKISTNDKISDPINLDNRVNSEDVVPTSIDYPSFIQCNFSINTDEEGYYRSVPNDKIERNDWKEYGDKGSEKINISNIDGASELTQSSTFSHNWYNVFDVLSYNTELYGDDYYEPINIPIISKYENWIESDVDYEKNMYNDGRGLRQRMWFRGNVDSDFKLPTNTSMANDKRGNLQWVDFVYCTNKKRLNNKWYYLDYSDSENSLYSYFFNSVNPNNDNIVLECYISPEEYQDILNGRKVIFDDNVYTVSKIDGFDVSGKNKTKLTLI